MNEHHFPVRAPCPRAPVTLCDHGADLGDSFVALLPLAAGALQDGALAHQRRRWQTGRPLAAEVYLRHLPTLAADEASAVALLQQEIHLRARHGETPPFDDYLRRFPRYQAALRAAWAGDDYNAFEHPTDLPPEPSRFQGAGSADPGLTESWPPCLAIEADTAAGAVTAPRGFTLLHELGRGGMGVVYLARVEAGGGLVALKMLRPGRHPDPRWVARLQREAEALTVLDHPNLVRRLDHGRAGDRPYLALEYVAGPTLAQHLRRGPLPAWRAADLVARLARGVQHAHDRGVLHRDLKPTNILLAPGSEPRVIDFGLARRLDDDCHLTGAGVLVGTPGYMAPEQANGQAEQLGPSTDVFGLGAVLYEALTGASPYAGADWVAAWEQACQARVLSPRVINPRIPRALEDICLKALAADPAERYPSAEALGWALDDYLARWRRQSALVLGTAGLVLLTALALLL